MKLSIFKGISRDLSDHLNHEITFGKFTDTPAEIDRDVLNGNHAIDGHCVWNSLKKEFLNPLILRE